MVVGVKKNELSEPTVVRATTTPSGPTTCAHSVADAGSVQPEKASETVCRAVTGKEDTVVWPGCASDTVVAVPVALKEPAVCIVVTRSRNTPALEKVSTVIVYVPVTGSAGTS